MHIYGLKEPNTIEIRYIGVSSNVQRRYKEHLKDKRETHKTKWIQSLLKQNIFPELVIIEEVTEENWDTREQFWIRYYKSTGARLTNSIDGGKGTINPSKETREKMSKHCREHPRKFWLGKTLSKDHKKKMSESHKGLVGNSTGKHPSQETKEKMRLAKLGKKMDEKVRQKMVGRKLSEETKKKISDSHKEKYKQDSIAWTVGETEFI